MATKTEVIELYHGNPDWTAADIACRLQCTDGYVRATLRRNGLRPRPGKATVISPQEAAERAINQRDLDILCDVKEGHSRRDIAKHWGVSESFVGRLVEAARAA